MYILWDSRSWLQILTFISFTWGRALWDGRAQFLRSASVFLFSVKRKLVVSKVYFSKKNKNFTMDSDVLR